MAYNKNQDKNSVSNEAKSLIRALEDRRDLRIQSSIEKEFVLRDLDGFKEKVKIELKHNNGLKLKLQQLKDINQREQEKHELMSSILSTFAKGNLSRVLAFSEDQVEKYKKMTNIKQAEFERKFKEQIDNHTKKNPLFLRFQEKQAELARLEQQLRALREERKCFTEKMKNEKQVNNLLFEQNIIEMAQYVLRYYDLNDKLKNPTKKVRKPTPLKRMMPKKTMPKRVLEKYSEPMVSNEDQTNDQNMPEASSTSKDHDMFDASEDGIGQSFDLSSPDHRGIRLDKIDEKSQRYNEVANKEPPNMLTSKTLKTQSFLNKQNVKEDTQKKDKYNLEQAKYSKHPSVSSLKATTEGSLTSQKSQKSKKAKVTFADTQPSQSSSFEIIPAKDKAGVSSSTFKRSSMNDVDMDMELMMENDNDNDNENQINPNEDVQMDDNDENISEIEIEDNIDEISNWTSLEVPSGNRKPNNKKPNSPESKVSSFDLDFTMSDNPVQQTNNTSKSTNDFFNFIGNDDIDDMRDLFQ